MKFLDSATGEAFVMSAVDSDEKSDGACDGDRFLDLAEIKVATHDCTDAEGEVLFVPGIFMFKAENYFPKLAKAFPKQRLTVLQWQAVSVSKLSWTSWKTAKYKADALAKYLAKTLVERGSDDLKRLTMVGHSLGGRVVLRALKELSGKNFIVRQVILMGCAMPYDTGMLADVRNMALEPALNLFKPSDRILKCAYYLAEKTPALGLLGARRKVDGLLEYRVPETDTEMSFWEKLESYRGNVYLDGLAQLICGDRGNVYLDVLAQAICGHMANVYLDGLAQVFCGQIQPEHIKIDHRAIAPPIPISFLLNPILMAGGIPLVRYCDWELIGYGIDQRGHSGHSYVIRNPFGELCSFDNNERDARHKFELLKSIIDKLI